MIRTFLRHYIFVPFQPSTGRTHLNFMALIKTLKTGAKIFLSKN